jgi:hypothetical protein
MHFSCTVIFTNYWMKLFLQYEIHVCHVRNDKRLWKQTTEIHYLQFWKGDAMGE